MDLESRLILLDWLLESGLEENLAESLSLRGGHTKMVVGPIVVEPGEHSNFFRVWSGAYWFDEFDYAVTRGVIEDMMIDKYPLSPFGKIYWKAVDGPSSFRPEEKGDAIDIVYTFAGEFSAA